MKLRHIHLALCLLTAFHISSVAFAADGTFLILKNWGEIAAGLFCAVIFSCLFVFLLHGIMKLAFRTKAGDIRIATMVVGSLAGVLLAPLPIATQEYMFIRKAPLITENGTLDYDEERWWPCDGYTLRGIRKAPDKWRFFVMD